MSTVHIFAGKLNASDLGPTLGLKKSSSLESLQTAVQEVVQEDIETDEAFYRQHTNKGANACTVSQILQGVC